jgi:hypothetical protein
MKVKTCFWRRILATGGLGTLLTASIALIPATPRTLTASPLGWWWNRHGGCAPTYGCGFCEEPPSEELGGTWYWLRSPEQEKRVIISLFNRYCVRCHGVDGRGVWDIPDVPNFTNVRWQASRTDGQLARVILEGRGAVMPPWRGTLSLEEAWAMARYLRTLLPGSEVSRPDLSAPEKSGPAPQQPVQPTAPPTP